MKVSMSNRNRLWIALAVLAVSATIPTSFAMDGHFSPLGGDRTDPWNSCTVCHGADLLGAGTAPACESCHNQFVSPDLPAAGHHISGRDAPLDNCTLCHGADLTGIVDVGPSCTSCHDQTWTDPGGGGENLPPLVDPGGPYSAAPGVPVNFDASNTTDAENDSLIYLWAFGDGEIALPSGNPIPEPHPYEEAGSYEVTLTVTDGTNTPVIVTFFVEIALNTNQSPTADAGGSYTSTEGDAVTLDGSGSSDPDGDSLTYTWNFGDNATGSGVTVSHTYTAPGTYTITLSVNDGVNASVTDTAQITVEEEVIVDPPDTGNPTVDLDGDTWDILVPFHTGELTITIEPFGPILLMYITHDDGSNSFGVGMEYAGNIFWMDVTGALYYGTLDSEAGTAWGMVFGYEGGGSSIWFGERQQ